MGGTVVVDSCEALNWRIARPEPVEGRAPCSWFDKRTTSGNAPIQAPPGVRRGSLDVSRWSRLIGLAMALALTAEQPGRAQAAAASLPELTQPVNDFADVVDAERAAAMDRMIRALLATTGDAVVVATVPTIEPFADIRE